MFRDTIKKGSRNEMIAKIEELSGQNVYDCYQCGNCSSGCPELEYMDIPPNQVLRLSQYGSAEEILNCETIWVCSTCLQCSSRCPKGIDVARVMEAYRTVNLRGGIGRINPRKIDVCAADDLPPILLVSAMRKLTG